MAFSGTTRKNFSSKSDTQQQIKGTTMLNLKRHTGVLLVTFTFLSSLASVNGASPNPGFTLEEVQAIHYFMQDMTTCFDSPGISVGFVRGRFTVATSTGYSDMETAHPSNSQTKFNLGSTAKALVPYILAEIMNGKGNQNGRLRWNTTIKELLKSQMGLSVDTPWADQTLREALTYRASGTPVSGPFPSSSAADMSTMAGLPDGITREDIVKRAIHFMPTISEFRSSGHYSNLMYTIVAHLAERLANKSYEQLVKDVVFDKLTMQNSQFTPAVLESMDLAFPHFARNDMFFMQNQSLFNLHPFEPVGSVMTSSEDMVKWLRHLLHNLNIKGGDSGINMLIGDAFVHSPTGPDPEKHTIPKDLRHTEEVILGHGMGWEVSEYKGRKRYMYTGHLYGYRSTIWLYPESQTAVYVAINGPSSISKSAVDNHLLTSLAITGILYQASDILHREKPWVTSDDVCNLGGVGKDDYESDEDDYLYNLNDEGVPLSDDVDYPVHPDAYVGSYGHGLVGDLVVGLDQSSMLTVKLGRNIEGKLRPKEGASTKLMLRATGLLKNTYEWLDEKVLEFLPASVSTSEGKEQFQVVRLYLTDKLYYDFKRGMVFDTMVVQVEQEKIRKAKEEEERKIREEKEAQMKIEAERKAKEEEEKRRQEEIERKEMLAAIAREKEAEEKAKEEAERKAMMEAVAREKAEEMARQEAEEKGRDTQSQAAALEKIDEATTSQNKASLVKQNDELNSHQSHQPYSESDDKAEVESLPPQKVTDGERKKSAQVNDNDKDGVGSGPMASMGLLLTAVLVVLVQSMIHRN
ncbi:hypothetical protein EGW08_004022 [Elysia chlorotica]|uniref:Beta-lactamase-related domain-containing protein n=1 Tax=Elysia chlorotica TaxID=188477 RepID=A0A433U309_ELYCH|nr:hypothetical protein EGW08_004022 [Elysia chlorotica]